jgi:hypothetical protein
MKSIEMTDEAFADLRNAFRENRRDTECFLDIEQGRVIWFSGDALGVADEPGDDAPDWLEEKYDERLQIWRDDTGRYLEVPPQDVTESCDDMEMFLDEEATDRLVEQFASSEIHRRTYERFADAVERDALNRERWREFRRERVGERVREWLELQGYRIEIVD